MKVYFYRDEEVGVKWPGPDHDFLGPDGRPREPTPQWPRFIWYNWPDSKVVDCPDEADVFVVRQRLIWLDGNQVLDLPHLVGNEHRHVFFDLGPDSDPRAFRGWMGFGGIIITATATQQMVRRNSNIVPWCWPVEDLGDCVMQDLVYDFVFQGQATLLTTRKAIASVTRSDLVTHLKINPDFYGQMAGGSRRRELRSTYLESLGKSRVSLCAASIPGVVRYRFYEAMSAGRCVVLICDECELPLQHKINYNYFTIFVPADQVDHTGYLVEQWLSDKDEAELRLRGAYARSVWERLLKREIWHRTIGDLVRARLGL